MKKIIAVCIIFILILFSFITGLFGNSATYQKLLYDIAILKRFVTE
jgi:hypothetical protein